jgi:hypothetical protein
MGFCFTYPFSLHQPVPSPLPLPSPTTCTQGIKITLYVFVCFNFRPPSNIADLVVCNNTVVVALNTNIIMRIDLSNTSEIDCKYFDYIYIGGIIVLRAAERG